MKRVNSLEINRSVRKILVRHWVDLGRVSIRTAAGTVHLRGELKRLPGAQDEFTTRTVTSMMEEMKRIKGLRRLNTDLENWRYDDMSRSWRSTDEQRDGSDKGRGFLEEERRGATLTINSKDHPES